MNQKVEAARHAACIGRSQQRRRDINDQGPKLRISAPVNDHHNTNTKEALGNKVVKRSLRSDLFLMNVLGAD